MFLALFLALGSGDLHAAQIDLVGPPGSVAFGAQVAVLPNGNLVVTDPRRSPDGAAYLYSPDLELISKVTNICPGTGSFAPLDSVRIVVLKNGNYLLTNSLWKNGSTSSAGMVAWASGETGLQGAISSTNALVGNRADDNVGDRVHALANGNYVVHSSRWSNGEEMVGAITWGSGSAGVSGVVTPQNSVVGNSFFESVSFGAALTNGNYVIVNRFLSTPQGAYVGGAMWADGSVGATGYMTVQNSLVGSTVEDFLLRKVLPLANGNFVIALPYWDNGDEINAGAVVWGDGTKPIVGTISSANALVGARTDNFVAYDEVQPLTNGNYVVVSSYWEGATGTNVGAVTWGNGTTGITGEVSAQNSLIGGADFQFIGGDPTYVVDGVVPLANGNYVVTSPHWNGQKGAITWGNGAQGIVGIVSPLNSLIGATNGDRLGLSWWSGVTPLTNGNYVVASPSWRNEGGMEVGAATWVDGSGPRTGTVNAGNSLVGTTLMSAGMDVVALTNGHYVVAFPGWDRGSVQQAGAVVWGNGYFGTNGTTSLQTALVGTHKQDYVGKPIALTDGNYIVCSDNFSTDSESFVGAVTWASGWGGRVGEIDTSNSLVGASTNDGLCSDWLDHQEPRLPDGQYLIASPKYDDGAIFNAGAFTWAETPLVGSVNRENSVIGSVSEGGEGGGRPGLFAAYDFANSRLVVGRPASNLVTVMTHSSEGGADLVGRISVDQSRVTVLVENLSATSFADNPNVQAKFDFTRRLGVVSPPPNCVAMSNATSRIFNCALATIAPGSSAELVFGISGVSPRGLNVSGSITTQSFEYDTTNNCFAASFGSTVPTPTPMSAACAAGPIRPVAPPRP
jgi:hypothetical protein